MTITLNGQPHVLEAEILLPEFLESLGLTGKPVVVEFNEQAILPREVSNTTIRSGDKLEIVTLAAGG